MKCRVCDAVPAWHDKPAPAGWRIAFAGFPFEEWSCPPCAEAERARERAEAIRESDSARRKRGLPGIITGEGYDQERYRALYGHDCKAVLELGAPEVKAWPGAVPIGKGKYAPRPESLDSPARRREFMKMFPRFEEA